MPEARLQRTREVYDVPYAVRRQQDVLEFARQVVGTCTYEWIAVTDPQTGHTSQVRIPRRFEVRP